MNIYPLEIQQETVVPHDNTDHIVRETYQTSDNDGGKRSGTEVAPSSQLDGQQRALLNDAFRNVDNRGFDDSDASLEIPSQDVSSGQSQLDLSFNLQSDNSFGVEDTNVGQQVDN